MLLLIGITTAAFIFGIPGVLFARLLVVTGLNRTLAVVAGSSIIPVAYVLCLTGLHQSGLVSVPWVGPIAAFLGGITTNFLYFRRR